tara:strand:+ start:822 stop:2021 length:1200 start_codon:yes stop_codon:yes gene_type:complete
MKQLLFILFLSNFLSSQIYDLSIPPDQNDEYGYADFRIWLNDSTDVYRGVYFFMHGWMGDSRNIVYDENLRELCTVNDFALMGAHMDNMHMDSGSGDAVIEILDSIAVLSQNSEIEYAPLFINGYSWGGQFGYHYTVWNPERVLGFITQKGGYHDTTDAGLAIQVPGFMFIGENDLDYRIENLTGIFETHRPVGARWILAMEQNAGHSQIQDWDMLDNYFETVTILRLPEEYDPNQPVALNSLPDSIAWLGNRDTWTIGSWECFSDSVDSATWCPSRTVAEQWQSFVSEGTVTDTCECDSTVGIQQSYNYPSEIKLSPAYPNPFNSILNIRFSSAETLHAASLRIFDIDGRFVNSIYEGDLTAGEHEFHWNASNQGSGVYFIHLKTGNTVKTTKVVYLK